MFARRFKRFLVLGVAWAGLAVGGETVRLGNVQVDSAQRTVAMPGRVNQVSGAIELLACWPGGKTHESVFVLDVSPVDLQAALLLLGLKPGTPPETLGHGAPRGPKVDLWVDWQSGGISNRLRAECFVYNHETRRSLPRTPWIFTGSIVEHGEFKALAEESLVATYWDPWAIINVPLPCGTNDEILGVNTKVVPPLGTPVRFWIKPR